MAPLSKNSPAAMASLRPASTKALQVQRQLQHKKVCSLKKVDRASKPMSSFIKKQLLLDDAVCERSLRKQLLQGLLLQLSTQRARMLLQIRRLQNDVASMETRIASEGSSATAIDPKAEDWSMDDVIDRMGVLSLFDRCMRFN